MEDIAPSATTQNRKVLIFGRPKKKDTVQKAPLGGRYWSLREQARTMGFAIPLHVHIDGFSNLYELIEPTMTPGQQQISFGNTQLVESIGV